MKKISAILFLVFTLCLTPLAFGKKAAREIPPTIVETTTIQYTTNQEQLTSTGSLYAIPGIVVKPEISGRITKIYFKSGDVVPAGAPLIQIYPDIIKARLVQAQADLENCQLTYQRAAKLHKTHDISDADYDRAIADYNASIGKVAETEAQLRQTEIVAPFAGRLGLSQVNLGDFVNVGQNIVNLQMTDPIYVDFSIPEIDMSRIVVGQEAVLHTESYSNESFKGNIVAIESLVNTANRTLMVRASAPNKDNKLIPGAFVEVKVDIGPKQQVLKVPQVALVYEADGDFVYKVIDGKAVKTKVTLGDRDDKNAIIASGVKVGDVIITAGQLKLRDGAPIHESTKNK